MDEISDVVRRQIAQRMNALIERSLFSTMTNSVAQPEQDTPFTMDKLRDAINSLGPPPPRNEGKIIESYLMVDRHEDWSKARSPSRTKRRMRYNAARIYTYTPKKTALKMPDGSLVMHPAMAYALRAHLKQQIT